MPNDVSVLAGDVLLFQGDSWIWPAIRWFDHSTVNHAAIALDAATLGQAGGSGLETASIASCVAGNHITVCRRLDSSPLPDMTPVTGCADRYLADGVPYAYHQIVLLAILAATRRIPLPWVAKRLVRSALDHAADVIGNYLDGNNGTRFMICSEYVYRCYNEASTAVPNPYTLRIDLGAESLTAGADPAASSSYLDWALRLESNVIDEATALSTPAPRALMADTDREDELNRLIQEYGAAAAGVDTFIAADLVGAPPPTVSSLAAMTEPEPTPAAILASQIRLAQALAQTRNDVEPIEPAGFGSDVLKGLLAGLLNVEASPNFVTPGDLLVRAEALQTVGEMEP